MPAQPAGRKAITDSFGSAGQLQSCKHRHCPKRNQIERTQSERKDRRRCCQATQCDHHGWASCPMGSTDADHVAKSDDDRYQSKIRGLKVSQPPVGGGLPRSYPLYRTPRHARTPFQAGSYARRSGPILAAPACHIPSTDFHYLSLHLESTAPGGCDWPGARAVWRVCPTTAGASPDRCEAA